MLSVVLRDLPLTHSLLILPHTWRQRTSSLYSLLDHKSHNAAFSAFLHTYAPVYRSLISWSIHAHTSSGANLSRSELNTHHHAAPPPFPPVLPHATGSISICTSGDRAFKLLHASTITLSPPADRVPGSSGAKGAWRRYRRPERQGQDGEASGSVSEREEHRRHSNHRERRSSVTPSTADQ